MRVVQGGEVRPGDAVDVISRAPVQQTIREVKYGSPEHAATIELRDKVLRKPLGLNPGLKTFSFSQQPAGRYAPKWLPSFTNWWYGALREESDVPRLLRTAGVVMGRRGQTLSDAHAAFYQRLFEQTAAERHRALRDAEQRQLRRSA